MRKEELERYLAEGLSLEQIGKRVGRNASTISYHLKKQGLKPVNQGKHAARGAIPELKLRTLAATGISVRAMARQLDRSPSTVRHWLKRYAIEYHGIKGNRKKALAARARGETVIVLRCRDHSETAFYRRTRRRVQVQAMPEGTGGPVASQCKGRPCSRSRWALCPMWL
jgi:IS30 family transposase